MGQCLHKAAPLVNRKDAWKERVEDLEKAINRGDAGLPVVHDLLNSGLSANTVIGQQSALYFAIDRDKTLAAELLLAHRAKVQRGYLTETPLHVAAVRGNVCIASRLVELGAKVNARNHDGCTPLWLAAYNGQYNVVQLLLKQRCVNLDYCCNNIFLSKQSVAGSSALCVATVFGHVLVCEALLQAGADADLKDFHGWTPLHHACQKGKEEIVRLLVQHGCSLNLPEPRVHPALLMAVLGRHTRVAEMLVQAGCDVNLVQVPYLMSVPLLVAIGRDDVDMVAVLCSSPDIHINTTDADGNTALLVACMESRLHSSIRRRCVFCYSKTREHFQQRQRAIQAQCSSDEKETQFWGGADSKEGCLSFGWTGRLSCGSDEAEYASLNDHILRMVLTLSPEQAAHLKIVHILLTKGVNLHCKSKRCKLWPKAIMAVEIAVKSRNLALVLLLLCHGASLGQDILWEILADRSNCTMHGLILSLMWCSRDYCKFFQSNCCNLPTENLNLFHSLRQTRVEQAMSLAGQCRDVVRKVLMKKTPCSISPLVQKLPVPQLLKEFLLLSDVLKRLVTLQSTGFPEAGRRHTEHCQ